MLDIRALLRPLPAPYVLIKSVKSVQPQQQFMTVLLNNLRNVCTTPSVRYIHLATGIGVRFALVVASSRFWTTVTKEVRGSSVRLLSSPVFAVENIKKICLLRRNSRRRRASKRLGPVLARSGIFKTRFLHISAIQMSNSKPNVIFVLGGPGAGKGTQCDKIVEKFNYVHLSAGDLLREERKREGSQYGELIDDHIKQGKIVPVEITCKLLENAMTNSKANKFLIDGFPRNLDNLQGWDKTMADKVNLRCVLFFNCSEEVCKQRCLGRGLAGSGRTDDNEETLKKRIDTYINETMPIIKHYEEQNLVECTDASNGPELVFEDVCKVLVKIEEKITSEK